MSLIQNKDPVQEAIDKNSCNKCRKKKIPICICKGAGASSDSASTSSLSDGDGPAASHTPSPKPKGIIPSALDDLLFPMEKLGDSLLIISDSSRGTLSLYLKPDANADEATLARSLMRMIRMAFAEFTADLARRGISLEGFYCNEDPNELIIRFPAPKYYDAFMQLLVDKKLLPADYIQQFMDSDGPTAIHMAASKPHNAAQQDHVALEEARSFYPTPFAMVPEPKNVPSKKNN